MQFVSGVEEEFPNFFQLPVLMLMLITLLNDGTLISVGYDNVRHSPRPGEAPRGLLVPMAFAPALGFCKGGTASKQVCAAARPVSESSSMPTRSLTAVTVPRCAAEKWNLRVLFLVSTVLGLVSMGSSLLLVGLVMDSVNPGSLFDNWHLPVPVRRLGAGWRWRACADPAVLASHTPQVVHSRAGCGGPHVLAHARPPHLCLHPA